MIRYEQIAATCRHMDAQADEGLDVEEVVTARGVDLDGLLRAAEQRAIRIALIMSGQDPRAVIAGRTQPFGLNLDAKTRELLGPLQLAFIDGFIAGHSTTDPDDRVQRFPEQGDT